MFELQKNLTLQGTIIFTMKNEITEKVFKKKSPTKKEHWETKPGREEMA